MRTSESLREPVRLGQDMFSSGKLTRNASLQWVMTPKLLASVT